MSTKLGEVHKSSLTLTVCFGSVAPILCVGFKEIQLQKTAPTAR